MCICVVVCAVGCSFVVAVCGCVYVVVCLFAYERPFVCLFVCECVLHVFACV